MKKLTAAALSFLILFIFGCEDTKPIIFNNHSINQTIAFTLTTGHRTANYTVKPGEQFTYDLAVNFKHTLVSYQSSPDADSVYLVQSDDIYDFYDISPPGPIPASIYNTLRKDVILSGDGAISTDPLTINAGEEIKTETILRDNPSFSAKTTDGYPVQVDYNFDGTIYMIILR